MSKTTTDTTATVDTTAAAAEQIVAMPIDRIGAHPDNVRTDPGDLADLTRSIKANGILQPAIVLPDDDEGMHLLVAGHRRRLAAIAAGLATMPVIVRDLDALAVLDVMMQENDQRSALTLADSIRAVARYQALDPKASPSKIAKRIGHTVAWVKARLAVAVLPADVLDLLNDGTLTLPWVTALATVADLGDDAVRACADTISRSRWGDPDNAVATWRRRRESEQHRDTLTAELIAKGMTVQHDANALRTAKAVQTTGYHGSLGLDKDQARKHRLEPCHVLCVRVDAWSDKAEVSEWCTDPRRHKTTKTRAASSDIVAVSPDKPAPRSDHAEQKARRTARGARLEAAVAMFAGRPPKQSTVIELAARAALIRVGSDDAKLAARWLGIETDTKAWDHSVRLSRWLDQGGDPTMMLLAVAGATHECYSSASDGLPTYDGKVTGSRAWLAVLARHGGHTGSADDFDPDALAAAEADDNHDESGDDEDDDTPVE